jgi:predicted nucleic acid-binding protein
MAWVVDTCLLIDIAEADPSFHPKTAALLDARRVDGLVICPMTFIELAPVFNGDIAAQVEFLSNLGVRWPEDWTLANTTAAHKEWSDYVGRKRAGHSAKRPIADVLIGAFATAHTGLLTRNSQDFRINFPNLQIVEPG